MFITMVSSLFFTTTDQANNLKALTYSFNKLVPDASLWLDPTWLNLRFSLPLTILSVSCDTFSLFCLIRFFSLG